MKVIFFSFFLVSNRNLLRYSFESVGTLNYFPSGPIIWLRHLVIELILGAGLSYILILSYKFESFKWPLYIMSLIFCYFRTKYKPGDFLCGPGSRTSQAQKVEEEESGGSAPPPPAGQSPPGGAGPLLRRRGGRRLSSYKTSASVNSLFITDSISANFSWWAKRATFWDAEFAGNIKVNIFKLN